MDKKIEIEKVSQEEYRLYNLLIEQLAKVIPKLDDAIASCKVLADHGWNTNDYKLQDAMCAIASVFAETVAGVKFIKPEKDETKGEVKWESRADESKELKG